MHLLVKVNVLVDVLLLVNHVVHVDQDVLVVLDVDLDVVADVVHIVVMDVLVVVLEIV